MVQWKNNILCIQGGWLYGDGKIMSEACYKQLTVRKEIDVIQRACRNRPALVAYESMPERFKSLIYAKIGNPYDYVKENEIQQHIKPDQKAFDFYKKHRFGDDRPLPDDAKLEYYNNAIVMNALHEILICRKGRRGALGKGMSNVWETLSDNVNRLDKQKYPHKLPENCRRLKEKHSDYLKEGYGLFIHAGFCNKNKEKLNDEVKLWVLAQWANNIERITSENHLLQEYNDYAKEQRKKSREAEKQWQEIKSVNTLHNFLYSEGIQVLWWGARYGELKTKEKFIYQHSTLLPTMRDGLWYSDGTKVNYYYLNENGAISTLSVYEVMDVYSEVLIGYAFCQNENYEAQRTAFKMALQTSGQKPYQVSFDNQGGHKKLAATSFLENMARIAIKTQPYNGKSKTIESMFGRYQEQFLKKDWFFTGQNITAKDKESRANMEYILANADKLPTLKEVKERYLQRRDEWNHAAHYKTGISRIEMYNKSTNPDAIKLSDDDMRDLFCTTRENKVQVTAYGISFKEDKKKYTYMIYRDGMPDVEWIANHVDARYVAKNDPDDMSQLHLYEETPTRGLRYVTTAVTKTEVHRGKQEQEEWESSYIMQIENKKKEVRIAKRDAMDDILKKHNLLPEQHGFNSPALKGIETSKPAKQRTEVITRIKQKQRTKGIAEVQKEISNAVTIGNDDEVDRILDGISNKFPLENKKKKEKNIYEII